MVDVGSYVGNIVDSAMEPVGGVLGDVATSVGNIATDLGGGIAGLAQDTGSLAQDVYNNTVNDPGAMMGIANVAGRVAGIPGLTAVAGPASIALGYMGQGERDKTLGINNPTALGRLARSLVPSIVQRPIFDFLGVTEDNSFGGYGTAEAEEEGVAGIDTSGTNPDAAIGGSEFSMDDPDTDTDTSTSTDTGDMQDPDDIDYGYDEDDDWAEGGAVGFSEGGIKFTPEEKDERLKRLYGERGSFVENPFYTEKITPGTRNERTNISFKGIPVGIEVLQNVRKQQLTAYPADVMENNKFKQQKIIESTRKTLKGTFKIDDARDFMIKNLLNPNEIRASVTKSEDEVTNENAEKLRRVANSFGFGTTLTLSPGDLNAIVNADFTTGPNYRNFSGNVGIPLSDDTTVNVGAQRNLIEGGQDFNTYEGGVNTKVGGGILGLNVRKNPRENYFGINFNKRF
tara:strand:- start:2746 stop:4113 length:1368 start_codon:yes stop_codon:yes gene_type:complete